MGAVQGWWAGTGVTALARTCPTTPGWSPPRFRARTRAWS